MVVVVFRGGGRGRGLGPVGVECVRKCRIICSMYVIKWLPPVRQSMDAATDADATAFYITVVVGGWCRSEAESDE